MRTEEKLLTLTQVPLEANAEVKVTTEWYRPYIMNLPSKSETSQDLLLRPVLRNGTTNKIDRYAFILLIVNTFQRNVRCHILLSA